MAEENKKREGKRAIKPSKKQLTRLIILGTVAVLLLALVITAVVFAIKVAIKPEPEQPDEPYKPITENPEDPGNNDKPASNETPGTADDPEEQKKLKDNFFTFLIGGTNDGYNVDSIMVGSIDMTTHKCNVISIPRDSMIDTDAKIKRINGTYGRVGMEGKGGLLYAVWGVTGIYPQYYCIVNMKTFIKIVDIIGGVEFDVPYDMYHADADPDFHIDLKKGYQTLNGKKAIQLVRFRGTKLNDFGRINMQKDFLIAMLKQVKNKFTIDKATSIIKTAYDSLKTNMPLDDMIYFYTEGLRKMNLNEDIQFYTMPWLGTGKYNGQDYVYLDEAKSIELINNTINPYTTPLSENDIYVQELYNNLGVNIEKW